MSRQIKFRAWDGNRMVTEPGYIQVHTDKDFHVFIEEEGQWENEYIHLMQFTGLQDKAGRDIYEGDVVKDRFGRIMQVQWWNFRLCWVAISETNFHHADLYDWVDFDYEKEEKSSTARVEVIGNVYENPELITHVSPQS
jgi:uncharacterized phage protein (TIGR01671 family)